MKSKAFVFLGLMFSVLLLITSAVEEEATFKEVEKVEVPVTNDGGYGWGGGRGGYGGGWGGGRGGYGGGWGGGRGGYGGGWGGGRGWGGGGWNGEKDGGYGGGGYGGWGWGGCRFGCCGYRRWGGGCQCCASAAEAITYMQNEAKP